jgi:NAD(P)-dependent dehydrogenase (short-subunit alcohol dehydrogenase family)
VPLAGRAAVTRFAWRRKAPISSPWISVPSWRRCSTRWVPPKLEQTVAEVEKLGRRIVARQADVRDVSALKKAFEEGVTELGPVDIVLANAGIGAGGAAAPEDQEWEEVIGVNLTGVRSPSISAGMRVTFSSADR